MASFFEEGDSFGEGGGRPRGCLCFDGFGDCVLNVVLGGCWNGADGFAGCWIKVDDGSV